MPDRLANETSLHPQQNADKSVDWWPWGEEALQSWKSNRLSFEEDNGHVR